MFNPRAGTTLIETLVYVFLLGLFAVLVVNLLTAMMTSYAQFRGISDTTHSASVAFERLVRELRQAEGINSITPTHPGRIVLNTREADGDPTTIEFYINAGTLMIREGAAAAASSTSPQLTVSNLTFQQIDTAESQAVRVEMTLSRSAVGRVPARADKFYDTIVLRGSY